MKTLMVFRNVLLFATVVFVLSALSFIVEVILWAAVAHRLSSFGIICFFSSIALWYIAFKVLQVLVLRYSKKHQVTEDFIQTQIIHPQNKNNDGSPTN